MTDKNDKGQTPPAFPPLSRRTLMQGAGAIGATAAFGGLTAASALIAPTAAAAAAAYDPKKYAGTKITYLMIGGEGDDRALADLLPEFEAETGMTLEIQAPAIGAQIQKTVQNVQAPVSSFELVNYIAFLTTQQVGGGYYEQLNQFIDNPEETPADWDFPDFIPAAVKNCGIYDMATGTVGQGDAVYGIPAMHSGSVIYFYRKDLFEAAGLKPATTWEEFHNAAKVLTKGDVSGASFIGANDFSLALVEWYTRFITIGGVLMTGSPKEKNFMPQVNSPEGIQALQMMIDLLPYAPKNVTQYGFAENVDGFASGKIAQLVFWSTIAGGVVDPEKSLVADHVGTGPVPAAPGQRARAIQGGWGTAIPKNVDPAKKAAAWRALTWISNKRVNKYVIDKYQIDANRVSAFKDPELSARFPHLKDSLNAIETAETIPIARIDQFFELIDAMNIEFNAALIGTQDAKTAADKAQASWETILRKAGHLA
jgi:multiple sugar transport system substrate-binding protein